jgi:hypothetical protein
MEKREIVTGRVTGSPMVKVLSWNVWGGAHNDYLQERMESVVQQVKREQPDVASLLDVSESALDILTHGLSKMYLMFQVFKDSGVSTGTVLLCNRSTVQIHKGTQPYYYDFPAGSNVIGAELNHIETGLYFNVLATRLNDNPDSDHVRESQMEIVAQVVRSFSNFFLIGDINSYSMEEPVESKLSSINDSFTVLQCPARVKFTYDGQRNSLVTSKLQLRNTRLMFKTKMRQLSCISLGLVGQSVLPDIGIETSMYYGLVGLYSIKS